MNPAIKIVAHRARGFQHPENSLPAIIAAYKSSVDEVEIDVRRCSDHTWVVHHSPFLPGFAPPFKLIKNTDSTTAQGKQLVLLAEVLELSKSQLGDKRLRIEFKDSFFSGKLLEEIARSELSEKVVVTAWSLPLLRQVHEQFPRLQLCLSLVEGFSIKIWNQDISFLDSICIVPTLSRMLPIEQFRLRNLSPDLYVVSHSTEWGRRLLTASWCSGVFTKDPMSLLHLRDSGLDQSSLADPSV
jgi:hypothetical protein